MTEFKDVQVGHRVRLTHENGDVAEVTVKTTYDNGTGVESHHHTYNMYQGWSVEILNPNEPTKNGTVVTYFDTAEDADVMIVKNIHGWTNVDTGFTYKWETWVDNAKPGSVKVVYTHGS